jgi:hypothetical protein
MQDETHLAGSRVAIVRLQQRAKITNPLHQQAHAIVRS